MGFEQFTLIIPWKYAKRHNVIEYKELMFLQFEFHLLLFIPPPPYIQSALVNDWNFMPDSALPHFHTPNVMKIYCFCARSTFIYVIHLSELA